MSNRFFAAKVHARLQGLHDGELTVVDGATTTRAGSASDLQATVTVHDPRFYRAIALGGHLGAAEAYVHGWWDAEDLPALVQLLARNRDAVDGLEAGLARLLQPLRRLALWAQRNTRAESRENIRAHYDLGNDFFAAFLDDTMTYSSGIFESADTTMREASVAKYERLCGMLDIGRGDRVIEIGTGWGGFALHAAANYDCHVVTTTISPAQHQEATARIRHAGLGGRITVLLQDYRDLKGQFDKLVSIEMIEAIGYRAYPAFFRKCAQLLASDGLAAIQAITIQDRFYHAAKDEVDFIKKYIFPGSCIPSVGAMTSALGGTDLRLLQLDDIALHYAETLRRWRERFEANWPVIAKQGFDEKFRRLWQFYFAYCEGGFREGVIGNSQMLFAKPLAVRPMQAAPSLILSGDR